MEEHVERACAGVRALHLKKQEVTFLLYIGEEPMDALPHISDIGVLIPSIIIDPYQFGTVMPILYIPCDLLGEIDFLTYKRAYEGYNYE